jgi:hypothetical protein
MAADRRIDKTWALAFGLAAAAERGSVRPMTFDELIEVVGTLQYAQHRIDMLERQYDRLALCPDHRDKVTGRCVVCIAEERTRYEAQLEREANGCEHDWQEQPGEPACDVCSGCGEVRY